MKTIETVKFYEQDTDKVFRVPLTPFRYDLFMCAIYISWYFRDIQYAFEYFGFRTLEDD